MAEMLVQNLGYIPLGMYMSCMLNLYFMLRINYNCRTQVNEAIKCLKDINSQGLSLEGCTQDRYLFDQVAFVEIYWNAQLQGMLESLNHCVAILYDKVYGYYSM